jgi:hypothetical protein
LPFAFSLLLDEKTAGNSEITANDLAVIRSRECQEPRISADIASSLADNFREEQRKQREAHAPLAAVQPVFDQAAGDRIQARQAERVIVDVRDESQSRANQRASSSSP